MPFVSENDRRAFDQSLVPGEYEPESTFRETYVASASLFIDEDLSISSALNNEMYFRRQKQTRELIDQGVIDRSKYEDFSGVFDYDQAALDLRAKFEGMGRPGEVPDMIKTDAELRTERNEMLRIRREEAQDVISRGSGIAQFAGTGSALLLDPINFIGLGAGLAIGTGKSLSTLGRALYTARTEGAIAAATETAIQPFVFAHKNDIESPYSVEDALANIGIATAFGTGLGFVAGGLTGYFRNARDKTRESVVSQQTDADTVIPEIGQYVEAKAEVRSLLKERNDYVDDLIVRRDAGELSPERFSDLMENGEPMVRYKEAKARRDTIDRRLDGALVQRLGDNPKELQVAMDRLRQPEEILEFRNESRRPNANRIYDTEYQDFLEGRTKTLAETRDKTIREMEKQIRKLEKQDKNLTTWIEQNGGLNKASWGREFGLEPTQMSTRAGWSAKIWRAGKAGMAPDELGARLEHDPTLAFEFQYSRTAPSTTDKDKVFEWFEPLISDKNIPLYPEIRMEIDDLAQNIRQLQEAEIDTLDSIYRDAAQKVMADDLETLAEYYRTELRMNQPTRVPEDYDQPIHVLDLEETDIQVKSVERQVLSKEGVSEAHDEIMAEYRKLTDEERAIDIEGETISADELIAGYEKDLEGLDELIRCTRSA